MDEKVFGMTLKEIEEMQKEILGWVDSNHPFVKTPEGQDGFRVAFMEGAKELGEDPHTKEVFSKIQKM